MLDAASESKHAFAIHDAKDTYKQRYPDETSVTDTGYGQLDGTYAFTLRGLAPGKPIVVLFRTDVIMGMYQLVVVAGGKEIGGVAVDVANRRCRWRNWRFRSTPST